MTEWLFVLACLALLGIALWRLTADERAEHAAEVRRVREAHARHESYCERPGCHQEPGHGQIHY